MIEIGYDAEKMPLGKLSKKTIMAGYAVLKQIGEELAAGRFAGICLLPLTIYRRVAQCTARRAS